MRMDEPNYFADIPRNPTNPKGSPLLNEAEVQFSKNVYGKDDKESNSAYISPYEIEERELHDIESKLLNPRTSFAEKFSILQMLIEDRTELDGDPHFPPREIDEILEKYVQIEKNFFLKKLLENYKKESPENLPPLSQESKKLFVEEQCCLEVNSEGAHVVQKFDDSIRSSSLWQPSISPMAIPRNINSIQELTDTEINEIYAKLQQEDSMFFSGKELWNFERRRIYENIHPESFAIPIDSFQDIYDVSDYLNSTFISKIGKNHAGHYDIHGRIVKISELPKEGNEFERGNNLRELVDVLIEYQLSSRSQYKAFNASGFFHNHRGVLMSLPVTFQEALQRDELNEEEIFNALCTYIETINSTKSPMKEISAEELFAGFNTLTKDPEQSLDVYRAFLSLRIRSNLEDHFGIDISEFSFRTQLQFLQYLSEKDDTAVERVRAFLTQASSPQQKQYRIQSFLSLEEGVPEETIFGISAELPTSVADHVFQKYSELVGTVDMIESFIREQFNVKEESTETLSTIRLSVLREANSLLSHAHEVFRGLAFQHQQTIDAGIVDQSFESNSDEYWGNEFKKMEQEEMTKLEEMLDHINADTILFLNSFKTLKEAGSDFSLEDIKQCEFAIRAGSEVPDEDTATMRSIYSQNQSSVGAHDEIMAHFDTRVQNPDARFYIFKRQDIIQSFIAFEPSRRLNGALEATSFNVSPEARGYKIGEAMLEEAIEREAYYNILEAECYAHLPISSKYIETGWVADGYFTEAGKNEGDIDHLLTIQRNDIQNELYWGKGEVSTEQITHRKNIPHYVTVTSAQEQTKLPFEEHFGEGRVLTRMFFDPITRKYFGVFEPHRRMRSHHNTPESSVDGV